MNIKRQVYKYVVSPLLDIATTKRIRRRGYYEISPAGRPVESFELWLPGRGSFQRRRIRGELEPDVMKTLIAEVNPGDVVFDVGAAFGYFSLAVAAAGGEVYAFELDPNRTARIDEATVRNGLDVTTVSGAVGDDVCLDDYPMPDVVKMDIEGWEYEALADAPGLLADGPVLLIELHSPEVATKSAPAHEIEKVYDLLHDFGYAIEELEERSGSNYHIVARK